MPYASISASSTSLWRRIGSVETIRRWQTDKKEAKRHDRTEPKKLRVLALGPVDGTTTGQQQAFIAFVNNSGHDVTVSNY